MGQLGGQLRVDSKPGVGSQFVFLIPFSLPRTRSIKSSNSSSRALSFSSHSGKAASAGSRPPSNAQEEIDSLVEAIGRSPGLASASPVDRFSSQADLVAVDPRTDPTTAKATARATMRSDRRPVSEGEVELNDSNFPLRSVRVDSADVEAVGSSSSLANRAPAGFPKMLDKPSKEPSRLPRKSITQPSFASDKPSFNVLIVEV